MKRQGLDYWYYERLRDWFNKKYVEECYEIASERISNKKFEHKKEIKGFFKRIKFIINYENNYQLNDIMRLTKRLLKEKWDKREGKNE